MDATYTPEQCQAICALEDDIVKLNETAEKLRFLIDVVEEAVFQPAFSKDDCCLLVNEVNRHMPGMMIVDDCLCTIEGLLGRMNKVIQQRESRKKALCITADQSTMQRA